MSAKTLQHRRRKFLTDVPYQKTSFDNKHNLIKSELKHDEHQDVVKTNNLCMTVVHHHMQGV